MRLTTPVLVTKDSKRRRGGKDRDSDRSSTASQVSANGVNEISKKDKKKRSPDGQLIKDLVEASSTVMGAAMSPDCIDSVSISELSGSDARSVRPSPSAPSIGHPTRVVDEDYDEGVADTLMKLASTGSYRISNEGATPASADAFPNFDRFKNSIIKSHGLPRDSISPSSSQAPSSPPAMVTAAGTTDVSAIRSQRTISPDLTRDEQNSTTVKRTRIEILNRRSSIDSRTPVPLPVSRLSPIPFRTQPSHSLEDCTPSLVSTGLPATLPLPPPPSATAAPVPNEIAHSFIVPLIPTIPATSDNGNMSITSARKDDDSGKSVVGEHIRSPSPLERSDVVHTATSPMSDLVQTLKSPSQRSPAP